MDDMHWTYLTIPETLDALALDLQQYDPQPALLKEIFARLSAGHPVRPPPLSQAEQATFYLIHLLETLPLSPRELADIAGRMLETRALADRDSPGIWVRDQMDRFECLQCGVCCTHLFYETGCTPEDYQAWQAAGLSRILERVRVVEGQTGSPEYHIWMNPKTGAMEPECPWLVPNQNGRPMECSIQAHKPMVCRQYPFTRKHARLTGCRGRFHHAPRTRPMPPLPLDASPS